MDKIRFDDIIDISKAQTIQDYFSRALGLSLVIINPKGLTLTNPSGPAPLTSRILRSSIEMKFEERFYHFRDHTSADWRQGTRCYDHFFDFAVPMEAGGETLAYTIVGPVIVGKRGTRERYSKIAGFFGVDEQNFIDAVREIKAFSFTGIKTVLELIHEVGCAMCEAGYRNYQMRSAKKQISRLVNQSFSRYVDKLLKSLTETAYSCLGADRASFMLWDKKAKELYIKTAKGLQAEIIKEVHLKLGEGLAGFAAEQEKPLFIDQSRPEKEFLPRMKNPSLQKAFLLPLKVKDNLYGVLNLASSKKENKSFSPEHLDTVTGLARLVETALSSL